MYFRQLRLPDIGCASYIVGGDGVCAAVDPRWDAVPQYLGLARQQGFTVTHILETHTHADHVWGVTRLAARTGATILIHRDAQVTYLHRNLEDGEEIAVGPARLLSIHTPGHSLDSISLLVSEVDATATPRLLSRDTLFVDDVGRPDLHGSQAAGLAATYDETVAIILAHWPWGEPRTVSDFVHLFGSRWTDAEVEAAVWKLVGDAVAEGRLLADLTEVVLDQTIPLALLEPGFPPILPDPLPSELEVAMYEEALFQSRDEDITLDPRVGIPGPIFDASTLESADQQALFHRNLAAVTAVLEHRSSSREGD